MHFQVLGSVTVHAHIYESVYHFGRKRGFLDELCVDFKVFDFYGLVEVDDDVSVDLHSIVHDLQWGIHQHEIYPAIHTRHPPLLNIQLTISRLDIHKLIPAPHNLLIILQQISLRQRTRYEDHYHPTHIRLQNLENTLQMLLLIAIEIELYQIEHWHILIQFTA